MNLFSNITKAGRIVNYANLQPVEKILQAFNKRWHDIVHTQYSNDTRLHSACRYALTGEGKRVRPLLVLLWNQYCGGRLDNAFPAAAAVEFVHTYSLVHDDLPCMDDDDMRRGRPTVHIQYDEHTAVLTGDCLLSDAFGIITNQEVVKDLPATAVLTMVKTLAGAIGGDGMVQGQDWDMSNNNLNNDIQTVTKIHHYKTGKLIEASCVLGALSAGAGPSAIQTATVFGKNLGLCFQIQDDLLDTKEATGKSAGKDATQNKMTFRNLLTPDEASRKVQGLAAQAISSLDSKNALTPAITALVEQLLTRTK
jgi:geranylgeranyl pyrophosphate synthase